MALLFRWTYLFTGLCKELNHKNKLEYYCKNHNKLCCANCLTKIKGNGNGQHSDCNACYIKEIEEEKKSKLKENIEYLEEYSENIGESTIKLKDLYENIIKAKEEIKLNISKTFTKIRNMINEREGQLLLELDNIFENTYFNEELIKKGEKITSQIKCILEKGRLTIKEWNEKNKLIERINDCIKIEYIIETIREIIENIEKCISDKIKIIFLQENEYYEHLIEDIKECCEIIKEEKEEKEEEYPEERIKRIKKKKKKNIGKKE